MSEESTLWDWPSVSTKRTPVMGKPIRRPFDRALWMPFSTDGMNSVGMAPPRTSFTNSNSLPSSSGST